MSGHAGIVRNVYAAFSRGDYAAALDRIDPEVEVEYRGVVLDAKGTYHGHAGLAELTGKILSSFDVESFQVTPEEIAEHGDRVAVSLHQRGTGRASGAPVEIRIGQVWTIRNGRVVRWEIYKTGEEAKAALDSAHQ